jgi:hypothetical protein
VRLKPEPLSQALADAHQAGPAKSATAVPWIVLGSKLSHKGMKRFSVRMHNRRSTRLTNGFSKKVENHAHSVALFAMYYNFVRLHKTLRTTPAMAAKVTERLWEMGDIVDVLEAWEAIK